MSRADMIRKILAYSFVAPGLTLILRADPSMNQVTQAGEAVALSICRSDELCARHLH